MLGILATSTICCFGLSVIGFIMVCIGDIVIRRENIATIGFVILIIGSSIGFILFASTKWMFIYELLKSL